MCSNSLGSFMLAPYHQDHGALDEVGRHIHAQSLEDIMRTLERFPRAGVQDALNDNQITCKRWLIDELFGALGGRFGTVYLLGGWYGVLAALLLNDARFDVRRVLSIDIDPECAPIARLLNQSHAGSRFEAVTARASCLDYLQFHEVPGSCDAALPNLLVNTSCEHMAVSEKWYDRVSEGMCQVYQSNDYFSCDEHVNCVASLEAFKDQVPMREILFEGSLARRRYTRFMLIGRK